MNAKLTREQLISCGRSFFRARHERAPAFKSGRRETQTVSQFKRYKYMVSYYFNKARNAAGGVHEAAQ